MQKLGAVSYKYETRALNLHSNSNLSSPTPLKVPAKSSAMKVLLVCALIAVAQASVLLHHPGLISTGTSTQYRAQDNIGNYNFGYDEGHLSGGTFRRESGDALGNKIGSYGLSDADGRRRVVSYVADAAGFRANVQTNEPGVEPKDPAAVAINKAVVAAPVVSYAAPAPVAPIAPVVSYAAQAPVSSSVVSYTETAPVVSYAAPAPVAPVVSYAAPAHVVPAISHAAPAAVVSYSEVAPAVHYAAAPVSYGHAIAPASYGHAVAPVSYGHAAAPLSYGYNHGLAVPNYGLYGHHF